MGQGIEAGGTARRCGRRRGRLTAGGRHAARAGDAFESRLAVEPGSESGSRAASAGLGAAAPWRARGGRLGRALLCAAFALCAALALPAAASAAEPPALHVEGTRLVNAAGEAVQLRGVSTHGLAWYGEYVNAPLFKELRNDWGCNVVRLALYTQEHGGWCAGGDRAALRAKVLDGVRYAADAGLYAIVDWHILSDGNPLAHVDEAKAFFADVSRALAGRTNVIYEICNEPNGGATWADVKRYAQQVVPVIRANAPGAVVLVGTPEWSQRVDLAAADPLGFPNVMYTLHFYAATHGQDLRDRMNAAIAAGLPVFVSEFGVCRADGDGAPDEASLAAWVRALDARGVSWCMWSLCNKAEGASAIAGSCTKTSGFASGDLAPAGKWLRAQLATYGLAPEPFAPVGSGRFADVPDTHWAQKSGTLERADDAGLLRGHEREGYRVFEPDRALTRAEAACVLARMSGADGGDEPFPANATAWSDVRDRVWYTASLNWAEGAGVLHGAGGFVRPNDPVTREELCAMLRNFAAAAGADVTPAEPWCIWRYTDDAWRIHGWAQDSVAWAIEQGIIGKGSPTKLSPLAATTRAEAAAMFLRFAGLE